jgi:hypothetical protein
VGVQLVFVMRKVAGAQVTHATNGGPRARSSLSLSLVEHVKAYGSRQPRKRQVKCALLIHSWSRHDRSAGVTSASSMGGSETVASDPKTISMPHDLTDISVQYGLRLIRSSNNGRVCLRADD